MNEKHSRALLFVEAALAAALTLMLAIGLVFLVSTLRWSSSAQDEVLAAALSRLLPPSVPYSSEALFRENLEGFLLGAPLLVPLVHLWLELRFRGKTANESMQPTCVGARG